MDTRTTRHVVPGLLIVFAGLGYGLLVQHTIFSDGAGFVLWTRDETPVHPAHFLYLPVMTGWSRALGALGVSHYLACALLSAVSTAIGVGCCYAASRRLGMSIANAASVGGLLATCPVIVFFATVVEIHAPFFALVGVATLALADLIVRRRVPGAIWLGLATGAAYLMHATGGLLPVLTVSLLWTLGDTGDRRRDAKLAAVSCAVHAAVILVVPRLIGWLTGGDFSAAMALDKLTSSFGEALSRPRELLPTLVWEWLWPFAPLSVLWLGCLRDRGLRPAGLALGLALVPYVLLTFVYLKGFSATELFEERGAYLMPLAWPAAHLVVATAPRWVGIGAAVVAAVLAVAQVTAHDEPGKARDYARGVRELAEGKPVYLLAADTDFDPLAIALPDAEYLRLMDVLPNDPDAMATNAPVLVALLAQRIRAGQAVFLTGDGDALLANPPFDELRGAGEAFRNALDESLDLRRVEAHGFRGFELVLP